MEIRTGRKSDVNQLHALLNGSPELSGYNAAETYSKPWVNEVVKDKKRNIVLVAEEKKDALGFLIAHILPGKDILLNNLYVKPAHRKKGIASKLLKMFDDLGKKLKSPLTVSFVNISNDKMHAFMKKNKHSKGKTFHYYYKERA